MFLFQNLDVFLSIFHLWSKIEVYIYIDRTLKGWEGLDVWMSLTYAKHDVAAVCLPEQRASSSQMFLNLFEP